MEDFCFPPIQKKGSVGSVGVLLECANLEIEKDAYACVCVCVCVDIFFDPEGWNIPALHGVFIPT